MRAINWATLDRQTTGTVRCCLFQLANCARSLPEYGEVAWPGHEDLMDRLNVKTTRSVERCIEKLHALGLIECLQSRSDGKRMYRLNMPADPTISSLGTPNMSGQDYPDEQADPTISSLQPDNLVAPTRQSRRSDPTISSSPIIGEPNEPNEPIEPFAPEAQKGDGEVTGSKSSNLDQLPPEPKTLLTLEMAFELAEKNRMPATREQIRLVWEEQHMKRNTAGYWRDRWGRTLYDFRWALELHLRKLVNGEGPGKNAAPLSAGMRAKLIEETEREWEEHPANPQNGRQATVEQIRDFKILTEKLRRLRAGE